MLSGNNKKILDFSCTHGVWTLRSRSCYGGVDSWATDKERYGIRKMCREGVNTPPLDLFLFRKEKRGTIF